MSDVVVAELESPEQLVEAARRVRRLGFARCEAFTPFPIPELDVVLPIRRTRLPWIVFASGVAGGALALLIEWWTNAFDYAIDVGGRPLFSIPTDIPIVFETVVLAAASAAFAGVLLGARLPRLHDAVFDLPGFERTRVDRFWLIVEDAFVFADDIREADSASPPEARRSTLLRSIQDEDVGRLRTELEELGAVVHRQRLERSRP